MKVLKDLLEAIGSRLLSETDVKVVRLYNEDGEDPKLTPAVDVEFTPFEWREEGRESRSATLTVILHCHAASYEMPTMNAAGIDTQTPELDLVQAVDQALHNWKALPAGTPLRVTAVAPDSAFGMSRDWRLSATLTVNNC